MEEPSGHLTPISSKKAFQSRSGLSSVSSLDLFRLLEPKPPCSFISLDALETRSMNESGTLYLRESISAVDMSLCITITIGPRTMNLYSTESHTSFNAS